MNRVDGIIRCIIKGYSDRMESQLRDTALSGPHSQGDRGRQSCFRINADKANARVRIESQDINTPLTGDAYCYKQMITAFYCSQARTFNYIYALLLDCWGRVDYFI